MVLTSVIRTQIQFTEQQLQALKSRAARDNLSISELVRRAVDAWVNADQRLSDQERRQRAMAAAGQFRSGERDIAQKHDTYLTEAYKK
jgi:hypothetical protein